MFLHLKVPLLAIPRDWMTERGLRSQKQRTTHAHTGRNKIQSNGSGAALPFSRRYLFSQLPTYNLFIYASTYYWPNDRFSCSCLAALIFIMCRMCTAFHPSNTCAVRFMLLNWERNSSRRVSGNMWIVTPTVTSTFLQKKELRQWKAQEKLKSKDIFRELSLSLSSYLLLLISLLSLELSRRISPIYSIYLLTYYTLLLHHVQSARHSLNNTDTSPPLIYLSPRVSFRQFTEIKSEWSASSPLDLSTTFTTRSVSCGALAAAALGGWPKIRSVEQSSLSFPVNHIACFQRVPCRV